MFGFRRRRKLTHLWHKFRPIYEVNGVSLPSHPDTIGLLLWEPNWKSQIIDETLTRSPGLFIDVGANIGHTLIDYLASSERSGYIGFEPNPQCVERVSEIIAASKAEDCAIIPTGLSDASGILSLFFDPKRGSDTGATAVDADIRPVNNTKAMHVAVFRFDDVAPSVVGERKVSLIKIDVEGAEFEVLQGMAETIRLHRPKILFEVLHRLPGTDRERIMSRNAAISGFFKRIGYSISRIDKDSVDGTVNGYTPVTEFPDQNWSPANRHECDYLAAEEGKIVVT